MFCLGWAATGKQLFSQPRKANSHATANGSSLIESFPPPPVDRTAKVQVSPLVAERKNAGPEYTSISTGKLLQQIDGSGWLYRFAIAPDERTAALEYAIPNVEKGPQ